MTIKTWEKVFSEIQKKQPIKAVDIRRNLDLTVGQVSGALNTIRDKGLVEQAENKAYLVKQKDKSDFYIKALIDLEKNFPIPEKDDSDRYKNIYETVRNLIEENSK